MLFSSLTRCALLAPDISGLGGHQGSTSNRSELLRSLLILALFLFVNWLFLGAFGGGGAQQPAGAARKEDWTFIDCCYFTVICITTVGYGDVTPSSAGGKVYTIAFVFAAVALVGDALGHITQFFMDVEAATRAKATTKVLAETTRVLAEAQRARQKAAQRITGARGGLERLAGDGLRSQN